MSKTKISCCPWCGKQPELNQLTDGKYYYSCDNVKCVGNPITPAYKNKGSATKAWNNQYCRKLLKQLFKDLQGNAVFKVVSHEHVIWESNLSLEKLKQKYGVK